MLPTRPPITAEQAGTLLSQLYGFDAASIRELAGEVDRNFVVVTSQPSAAAAAPEDADAPPEPWAFVLKIAPGTVSLAPLQAQAAALRHLAAADLPFRVPRIVEGRHGELAQVEGPTGAALVVRLVDYIAGTPLADALAGTDERVRPELRRDIAEAAGEALARLDRAFFGFDHAVPERDPTWALERGVEVVRQRLGSVGEPGRRRQLEQIIALVENRVAPRVALLRSGVIHGDGNDHNLLVQPASPISDSPPALAGIIDFGDLCRSWLVAEPAIAAAYALLGDEDPVGVAARLAAGYHRSLALTDDELAAFFPLVCLRLAVSVAIAADRAEAARANPYLAISEAGAWAALERLVAEDPDSAHRRILGVCDACAVDAPAAERIRARRERHLGPNLSLSYRSPLHIVGGFGQHLWDASGRRFLDAVNNVPHVGHQHPRVVAAIHRQAARLNTNTRYLHALVVELAERLVATLPEPLSVCWFVNSGSEANDLALRLARAHTGRRGVVALQGGYHGHTSALIDVSPYKFAGPGGAGAPPHVRVAPLPDPWRGRHAGAGQGSGALYAADVARAARSLDEAGCPVAAFICEPVLSCGGQIVPPDGFLAAAFRAIRQAGGVCIADEVQIGFGRLGTHFWGFEAQGAVPDIVTMGKPMGNGHPVAAVVTTPAIAASFDTGMEFFSTYGGNPVSCAAALAVLDIIAEDGLQQHALRTGELLLSGLRELAQHHEAIGDVRGSGLFLGVELVADRAARRPAPELAADIVNRMCADGVLMSTDGPDRNVLKIKPPLAFGADDAAILVRALDRALAAPPQ